MFYMIILDAKHAKTLNHIIELLYHIIYHVFIIFLKKVTSDFF